MIDKLLHFALTQPASVYDEEALTALQLAGRTANKVNECVEEVNKQNENVSDAIAYMKTNLRGYTKAEIDKMREDGTLESFLNMNVLNTKASKASVEALASGSPRGAYETVTALQNADPNHTYIYVVTADNSWYYHNGTAWTKGGTYMATIGDAGQVPGYSVRFSEIILATPIYFNDTTKILTIPEKTYYSGDSNTLHNDIAYSSKHTEFDFSEVNRITWVLYDPSTDSYSMLSNQDTWNSTHRVVIMYYAGKFYGVNENAIIHTSDDLSVNGFTLSDFNYRMKHSAMNIKFIGDSIVAGVGASDYSLTDTLLMDGKTEKMASQDSVCWANKVGKSFKSKVVNKYRVIAPDEHNCKFTGQYSFLNNKFLPAYFVARFYDTCEFDFSGNKIEIAFWCYPATGQCNVYIDNTLITTVDTSSSLTDGTVLNKSFTTTTGKHTVKLVCTGKGANTTANSPTVNFGGATVTRSFSYQNFGYSGWNSQVLAYNIDKLVFSTDDIVFIGIGTNDRLIDQTPETTRFFVESVIDNALGKGCGVIICTPIPHPTEASNADYKCRIVDVVNVLTEVAERKNVLMIDFYHKLQEYCNSNGIDITSLYSDGLHPNDEGYSIMASIVSKTLMIW